MKKAYVLFKADSDGMTARVFPFRYMAEAAKSADFAGMIASNSRAGEAWQDDNGACFRCNGNGAVSEIVEIGEETPAALCYCDGNEMFPCLFTSARAAESEMGRCYAEAVVDTDEESRENSYMAADNAIVYNFSLSRPGIFPKSWGYVDGSKELAGVPQPYGAHFAGKEVLA